MRVRIVLILILSYLQVVLGGNILAVFPLAGRSVNYLYQRLLKGLADAGHTVTSISPHLFDLGISNGSVRDVVLTGFSDRFDRELAEILYEDEPPTILSREKLLQIYNKTLWHRNVREFVRKSKKLQFDVIIIDNLYSETLLVFSKIFDCPVVLFSSNGDPFSSTVVGNSMPPSYVKHSLLGSTRNKMGFMDRLHNILLYIQSFSVDNLYLIPMHNKIIRTAYRKRFNNDIDVIALRKQISLVLLNSHPTIRPAVALMPNVIEVAGFHIDPPQELTENLQEVLDQASEGVVFFSMGLGVRTRNIPAFKKQLFLNVFKKLNQTVIWKIDGEQLPEDLPNVFTMRWAPQKDLLAHPNLKLFINQGGYNSLLETVCRGIPSLTLPIFPDEIKIANQAKDDGYALSLPYKEVTEERLYSLIQELLNNPKYSKNTKLRSKIFSDRPIKPLDNAIYWIEHVIKYKGAEHLKVAGADLPLIQFYMLDVFCALAGLVVALVVGIKLACLKLCNRQKLKKVKSKKR